MLPYVKTRRFSALVCALLSGASAVYAQSFELTLPGHAVVTAQVFEASASRALPKSGFQNGAMALQNVEGPLAQTAFQIASDTPLTTLQLMGPLRDQIAAAGFKTIYQCETRTCGGFDFRYGMELVPEPEMHVDLGDFRYILAQRGVGDNPDYISLMISRSSNFGFVHLTRMGGFAATTPKLAEATKSPLLMSQTAEPAIQPPNPAADIQMALSTGKAAMLDDLNFQPSKASLDAGEYASMRAVSEWLTANPSQSIKVLGHTDSSGRADANLVLSQARADSIRDRLIAQYGVSADRISAIGMGDTAPIVPNDTADGRAKNRRVEAISTPTPN